MIEDSIDKIINPQFRADIILNKMTHYQEIVPSLLKDETVRLSSRMSLLMLFGKDVTESGLDFLILDEDQLFDSVFRNTDDSEDYEEYTALLQKHLNYILDDYFEHRYMSTPIDAIIENITERIYDVLSKTNASEELMGSICSEIARQFEEIFVKKGIRSIEFDW